MAFKALCYLYPAFSLACPIASLTTLTVIQRAPAQWPGAHEPTKETPALRHLLCFLPGMLFPQVFAWITPSLHSSLCLVITYVGLSPNNICKISTPVTLFSPSYLVFHVLILYITYYLLCELHKSKNLSYLQL